ncbi:hypothetical protein BHC44_09745 [Snodgrassella alvi]|nr:hypothetical protein BHC44_09745 [Snodgrassella alvi]
MRKFFICLFLMLPLISNAYPVYPKEAESLQSYELGEFVKMFMQVPVGASGKGYIDWDTYADNENFIWETDGVDSDETEDNGTVYFRKAMVRINVNGVKPLVLKKNWSEMAWNVRYLAYDNPKFGVESVYIDNECFAYDTQNCVLPPQKSFEKANIKYKKICQADRMASGKIVGYELSLDRFRKVYLSYETSAGSGGESAFYELHFSKPKKFCDTGEEE